MIFQNREKFEKKFIEQETYTKELKIKYEDLVKEHSKTKDDLRSEKEAFKSLEKDFDEKMKIHEEEVTIRLKFEKKLNDLHSLHSNLKNQYQRALLELEEQEKVSQLNSDKIITLEKDLIKVRTDLLHKEKSNTSLENKIHSLEAQIEE